MPAVLMGSFAEAKGKIPRLGAITRALAVPLINVRLDIFSDWWLLIFHLMFWKKWRIIITDLERLMQMIHPQAFTLDQRPKYGC